MNDSMLRWASIVLVVVIVGTIASVRTILKVYAQNEKNHHTDNHQEDSQNSDESNNDNNETEN